MAQERHKLLLCNCNRTMPLDGKAVAGALKLDEVPRIDSELCRRHVASFEAAVKSGDDIMVACTQEAPLFAELHGELKATGNIVRQYPRDRWRSAEAQQSMPNRRVAALADCPSGGAGRVLPVGGAVADHRPGGSGPRLG